MSASQSANENTAVSGAPRTSDAHGKALSVVVAGGGTAGHIEPAMAVADALRRLDPSIRVTARGAPRGRASARVAARGVPRGRVPAV
ncbi:glycosyltransferase, partial [Nocardia cyriacigeorgica]|uniref:glycosyltransferase n=1 Tax=Nocardia cyriacigeorgica TaxID=135487 RepID=UPI003CC7FEB8